MVAYRFCRPDDAALLVRAVNECYLVHFEGMAPFTVQDFKNEARELNVWASSCMVAMVGADPIAVCIAAKRETETLLCRIGVRPDYLRQGHGSHLLTSLRQKLAVLGPPRLIAEVPRDRPDVARFLESVDYRLEASTADFRRDERGPPEPAAELVFPVMLQEVLEDGIFDRALSRSWGRALQTLTNREERVRGLGIASTDRLEAYLLYLEQGGGREILSLGGAPDGEGAAYLELLVRSFLADGTFPVRVPGISAREVPFPTLMAWGFRIEREYDRYGYNVHGS